MGTEDTGGAGEKTFTQADVDRVVRERLARERQQNADKYGDYDDLKTKAAEADKNKSALDRLLEKVSGLEERASKAEATALRADVAQAKGLTPAQAKRLHGTTKAELEADADELLSMFKPADKGGKDDDDKGDDTDGAADKGGTDKGTSGSGEARKPATTRPTEKLTPGAVPATAGDKSAAEQAAEILKTTF